MKKIVFLISAMIFSQVVFGQFKVIQNGNVGIGTITPERKLDVKGELYVESDEINWGRAVWTKVKCPKTCSYNLFSKYLNKDVFYVCAEGWLWTLQGEYCGSDSSLKKNVSVIEQALETIKLLEGVKYQFIEATSDTSTSCGDTVGGENGFRFGLIAQDVELVLPEIVKTMPDSTKAIAYMDLIAVLIEGIKEQQVQIEEQQVQIDMLQQLVTLQEMDLIQLRDEVLVLRNELEICCDGKGELLEKDTIIYQNDTSTNNLNNLYEAVLYQNIPNPFNTNTQISFYIPTTAQTAYLYIYNLNGIQLKSYTLTQRGLNYITLYASELPAGMYLYTLVVDNVIIDSKRMILTK